MRPITWSGVFPAITTSFLPDGGVDHATLERHAAWLVDTGCRGIVPLGSLGEGGSLAAEEKAQVVRTLVRSVGSRVPVVAGVAAPGTEEAARTARAAAGAGADGLMVLPPYAYRGDPDEVRAHFAAVFAATPLPCMLYNNPVAYGTDAGPELVAALAEAHPNLEAVKESAADVRRFTALRALLGGRLALFAGVDDLIVESVAAGAEGWIAGLVNAFPAESVRLFDLARAGRAAEADRLYRWFLPLLRMDTVPKFVQLIKLVQQEMGFGSESVRLPRLALRGEERAAALRTLETCRRSAPA